MTLTIRGAQDENTPWNDKALKNGPILAGFSAIMTQIVLASVWNGRSASNPTDERNGPE